MPDIKRVKRPDWKLFPLPERFSTIPLNRTYSDEESDLIMAGFLPLEMEDKWFLFFENETLFCHRSWTGYCIYQVHFVREGDTSLRATYAEVNRYGRCRGSGAHLFNHSGFPVDKVVTGLNHAIP